MTFLANPTHYTRDEFRALVSGMKFDQGWTPLFPTLHNTGVPSLAMWESWGATPQERWGSNLNDYYRRLGWHSGPHLVCCPDYIWNLCDLRQDGVSVSCWNHATIGIECVGNYEVGGDDWDTGDGAKVRDNAVWVLAVLCQKFGWRPDVYVENRSGLHFHRECIADHHACPGSRVSKPDMITRVNALIPTIAAMPPVAARVALKAPADAADKPVASVEDIQSALNRLLDPSPNLAANGILGPETIAAVVTFQRERNLVVDGWPGPQTIAALTAPPPKPATPTAMLNRKALKVLTHPSGRQFKMGRRRPVARGPRLSLNNYLMRDLPAPPAEVDYSKKAAAFLSEILGNDTLGDCTAAGAFHVGGLLLGGAGEPIPFTLEQVIAFYSATTGYIPGDPSTDQGGNEQTVLHYWQETGLLPDKHRIAGWLGVGGTDETEVKTAIWLMENVYFGVELPDEWVNPMPEASGFVWDVAGDSDPDNGHCFVGVGYDAKGVKIDTWGMIGTITWAAVAKYASSKGRGELYTVLGPDAISKATKKAENGFDWSQLVADFDSMGGDVKPGVA